jgi:hypothetical protein
MAHYISNERHKIFVYNPDPTGFVPASDGEAALGRTVHDIEPGHYGPTNHIGSGCVNAEGWIVPAV